VCGKPSTLRSTQPARFAVVDRNLTIHQTTTKRNLHVTNFSYKENELYCEEVPLREIVEEFGTPLYVYSKNQILDNYRAVNAAFGEVSHLICYALKANSNLQLLKLLAQEEAGAEVVSRGELFLALKAGFSSEKIMYAGVGKREDEIEYAIKKSIASLNVESEEELRIASEIAQRLNLEASVSIRVNPNVEAETHPYILTGSKSNKFGIDQSRVLAAYRLAKELPNLRIVGIHAHIGSQIPTTEPFVQCANTLATLVQDLKAAGIDLANIDIGGGVGVDYHQAVTHDLLPTDSNGNPPPPTAADVVKAILPILQPSRCTIVFEPGRSIVADAGMLLTKVLYTKQGGEKKFIIVDAGINDLIRPSLYDAYHQIVPLRLRGAQTETVDVVGPICETGDFFALDRTLPTVVRGDFLGIATAGAYGFSESSNYNGRLRPAEILVNGEKCRVIRERETLDDLL
jgi:diaminopimelate decarboxylase